MMTKETVNAAYETTLRQGVMLERRLFHSMFATAGPEGRHGGLRRRNGRPSSRIREKAFKRPFLQAPSGGRAIILQDLN